jgi:2-oxoglutarate ferredoxin oxidoreductase subunit gamma
MSDPFKIIICGEGGQGALSVAEIIAVAAWHAGRQAVAMPFFSTEKRGGVSMAFVQFGDAPIVYPKFDKADLWVALSQRSVDRIYDYLQPQTQALVNSFLVKDVSRLADWRPHQIDAMTAAREQVGHPRTFNVVVLGAMLKLMPEIGREHLAAALERMFADKYERDPALRDLNLKALEIGAASLS